MLYDQAQLAVNYTEAYQITGDKYLGDIAGDILAYVERVMTAPENTAGGGEGFYSAEDAESALDSEEPKVKEEGAFYVWEKKEIDGLLGEDAEVFNYYFGVNDYGNAPQGSDPHSVFVEKNILYMAHSLSETSNKFEMSTDALSRIIEEGKKILFDAREKRPKSHLDDKILTTWNGLMITAFAKAYQAFGDVKYLERAKKSAEFILNNMYKTRSHTLLHRFRDGEAKIDGTLEDYSFFTQGLLDLYESCFEERYLEHAIGLTETMISDFYDSEEGGFFDTSGKDKSILVRTKEDYDSAEPTGNSLAIMNLIRLSYITGNTVWYEKAFDSVSAFSGKLQRMPYAMPQMLVALEYILNKPKQIVISGRKNDETAFRMIEYVHRKFMPDKILIFVEPDKISSSKTFAANVIAASDKTTAYVCENFACQLPVTTLKEFEKLIH